MGDYSVAADLTGQRFGWLTALSREGRIRSFAAWRCRCDCGAEIVARSDKLVGGQRKSCTINKHRWFVRRAPGLARLHPHEYSSWSAMRKRCEHKKARAYSRYGGRGIKVCKEWKKFAQFLKDMGPKPTPRHSIDRINNELGYQPGNCRWATDAEQRRNRRNLLIVEHEGRRVALMDLLQELGANKTVVRSRLAIGWTLEEALTIPVRAKKAKKYRKRLETK